MTAPDTLMLARPLDPLAFGDGRSVGHARFASSRPLPPPSQLAGILRSQWGRDPATGRFAEDPATVRTIPVEGPLVAILGRDGEVADWAFPTPADALAIEASRPGRLRIVPMRPLRLPDAGVWRSDRARHPPAGPPADVREKPASMPGLWRWRGGMEEWLSGALPAEVARPPAFALSLPGEEVRTHVSIDPVTGTAAEGMLFAVAGRRWTVDTPAGRVELALAARVPEAVAGRIGTRVIALGGERRLASIAPAVGTSLPAPPKPVIESARSGALRLVLATPAEFSGGSAPDPNGPLLIDENGVRAHIEAMIHGRPEVVSGWDLQSGGPKPTRRLLPAGSVLFLRLEGGDADAREGWLRSRWLRPVSDDPQARRDGFGLALFGRWSPDEVHEL